jgi:putative hydrolase of the HAD superfamily
MITTLLFDLDDTLYPPATGIMDQIRARMLLYLRTYLGVSGEEADVMRRRYFEAYGTTMRGLQINHAIDPDEFLRFVHDIPLQSYLVANPRLDAALQAIEQEKVIFTNACRSHAERVLAILGIRARFSRIVDVRDVDYESKPQPAAYQRICELLGVLPQHCLLIEDSIRNLHPARSLGMVTVLVHHNGAVPDGSTDYAIEQIEQIDEVVKAITYGGRPS